MQSNLLTVWDYRYQCGGYIYLHFRTAFTRASWQVLLRRRRREDWIVLNCLSANFRTAFFNQLNICLRECLLHDLSCKKKKNRARTEKRTCRKVQSIRIFTPQAHQSFHFSAFFTFPDFASFGEHDRYDTTRRHNQSMPQIALTGCSNNEQRLGGGWWFE